MSNKDKQTMDYWRHSTNLFEEPEMELSVTHKGLDAYGVKRLITILQVVY